MKVFKPVIMESIRRLVVLAVVAFFAWMFFFTPQNIYRIDVKDYRQSYESKVRSGAIDPLSISFEAFIASQMKGPYAWSERRKNITEVEDEKLSAFLNEVLMVNRGKSSDSFIARHRSVERYWVSESYFFAQDELPGDFFTDALLRDSDYFVTVGEGGEKRYFRINLLDRPSMLDDAPQFVAHPLRSYAYWLLLFALIAYIALPRPKVPQGAAYYARLNAVYLTDTLSIILWTVAWMFFFLPDESVPVIVNYFMLVFFGIFSLAIVLPTIKYAASWFRFVDDAFEWSDIDGIGRVSLEDIVSVKHYIRTLPKWVSPLIILLGRGSPGPTGIGLITATSAPEEGMDITTRSGKKIRVMANYLLSDTEFTKRFKALAKRVEANTKR